MSEAIEKAAEAQIKSEGFKVCPFCGGTDQVLSNELRFMGGLDHYVLCNDCFAQGGKSVTRLMALAAWNDRS